MQSAASVRGGAPRIASFPGSDIDTEPDVWSGAAIDDNRITALAVGAYYGRSWGAHCDGVAFLPEEPDSTVTRRETAIEGLHESWGVDNAEDARDTVRRLLAGMHAPLFELVHPLAVAAAGDNGRVDRTGLADEHREFLHTLSGFRGYRGPAGIDRDYDAWLQAIKLGITDSLPSPLQTDATAWDLARLVFIARAACTAGYLTEDEAWEHMLTGLDRARQHYRNWRQFGDGFLTGAIFWAATQDLSAAKRQVAERSRMIAGLHLRPSSPWRRVALHRGAPVFSPASPA
ncbi:DUF1266 domain-containing protein [Nocardia sp. AG03]|uniref:DUF1266 domain-containing protein n=1 Tax=Nocardia sp. AG03 TaxID=3025312 RepID=UPI002418A198|nr:DUF1266 domain-containing protein [Nocardia sp. AG03]